MSNTAELEEEKDIIWISDQADGGPHNCARDMSEYVYKANFKHLLPIKLNTLIQGPM